jgi:hypothetical protein
MARLGFPMNGNDNTANWNMVWLHGFLLAHPIPAAGAPMKIWIQIDIHADSIRVFSRMSDGSSGTLLAVQGRKSRWDLSR